MGVLTPAASHRVCMVHRALITPVSPHVLLSLPGTFIDGHGAGVELACQQHAWEGVCVFSASITNSEPITI